VSWWHVSAATNGVILVALGAVGVSLGRQLLIQRRWRSSPLAVATAGVFLTSAIHHGFHPGHELLTALGSEGEVGAALRRTFDAWHISTWNVLLALTALWCWAMRSRLPALVGRSTRFEDSLERERQALEIHDNVVQGLATAKLAFELNETERGMSALEQTLAGARRIITDLLDTPRELPLDPGELRRDRPAGGAASDR